MPRITLSIVALVVLIAACREQRGPRTMIGTYQFHDTSNFTMLAFVDRSHVKWEPGPKKDWIYLVVGDTLLLQREGVDAGRSARFLIKGDSLVWIDAPSIVFVRTR